MKNPFTFRIESWLGAVLLLALSGFFVALFFIYMKDYNSELTSLDPASNGNTKWLASAHIPAEERQQMLEWVQVNNIELPQSGDKIRYLIVKYPDRPWLN